MHFSSLFLGFTAGFIFDVQNFSLIFWCSQLGMSYVMLGVLHATCISQIISTFMHPLMRKYLSRHNPRSALYIRNLLMLSQTTSALLIMCMGCINPMSSIILIIIVSVALSFAHAIQDNLCAYKRSITKLYLIDTSSNSYVIGFRSGMIIASLSLIISELTNWEITFYILGCCTLCFPLITLFAYDIYAIEKINIKNSNEEKNISIKKNILQYSLLMIIIGMFYKTANHSIVPMLNPFLIEMGFLPSDVMLYGKWLGLISSLVGSLIAHKLLKQNNKRIMIYYGFLLNLSYILFMLNIKNNQYLLGLITIITGVLNGISISACMNYISQISSKTQNSSLYSIHQGFMNMSRSVLPILAGFAIPVIGWQKLFLSSSMIGVLFVMIISLLIKTRKKPC